MTEFDIQNQLFNTFLTLNESSGRNYLLKEGDEYTNVHFPNVPFSIPENKTWYDLTFRVSNASDSAIMGKNQTRVAGVLDVDIMAQQDVGEEEVQEKYRCISKLFLNADMEDVDVMSVYISTKGNDADYYKLQVAIEWTADIDKE